MKRSDLPAMARLVGLVAITAQLVCAQTLYVDGTHGSDFHAGDRRTKPLRTLDDALSRARSDSSVREILVTRGHYMPGTHFSHTFALVSDVAIRGGYERGFLVRGASPTILDGDERRGTVVTAVGVQGARLDGLWIQDGRIGRVHGGSVGGGGLFVDDSDLLVTNCRFFSNQSTDYGGAAWVVGSSSVLFNDCDFVQNRSNRGGALAFGATQAPDSLVLRCRFLGNDGFAGGGAVVHYRGEVDYWNSVFAHNDGFDGGAILALGGSAPRVSGCTIAQNSAVNGGGVAILSTDLRITNSIVRDNVGTGSDPDLFDATGSFELFYNSLGPVAVSRPGFRNFDLDPNFIDPDGADGIRGTIDDDFGLHHPAIATSPCVDRGSNSYVGGAHLQLDVDGQDRVMNPDPDSLATARIDLGAHEVRPLQVLLPGSDEGIELRITRNGELAHSFTNDSVPLTAGDRVAAYLESSDGTRSGDPGHVFLEVVPEGTLPSLPSSLLGFHVTPFLIDLPTVVSPGWLAFELVIPPGIGAFDILAQGFVEDPTAANGFGPVSSARLLSIN